VNDALPRGPRLPAAAQTAAWWRRPRAFLERCRDRYGSTFTIRLLGQPPFVHFADPDDIRAIFTAPPDVLHPGEGARVLEPILGRNSVILLDEGAHLEQRRLMLPAFHGERIARLEALVTEVAEEEIDRWPRGEAIALHPRLQALTLEVILRAVFGVAAGDRLEALREHLTAVLELGARPVAMLPQLRRLPGGRARWERIDRITGDADALIYELIAERRADPAAGERDDVLAMLLAARHEDDTPMSDGELRDELVTLLVAGHETTASELAWAFERLAREPAVTHRLQAELDADDEAYLTATVQETLRRRPVLPNAAPRMVRRPIEVGGREYPPGVCLVANAYLVQHDPAIYPDPYAFRPERFLDSPPGTYTWIPFGGGRRRCLGASFALLEMKVVLRAVLGRSDIRPAGDGLELARRRSITLSPAEGARTVLRERTAA